MPVHYCAVGLTSWAAWSATPKSHPNAVAEAAVLGVIAFALALIVLQFCISVLLNVTDAVFICYAMDLAGGSLETPHSTDVELSAVRLYSLYLD